MVPCRLLDLVDQPRRALKVPQGLGILLSQPGILFGSGLPATRHRLARTITGGSLELRLTVEPAWVISCKKYRCGKRLQRCLQAGQVHVQDSGARACDVQCLQLIGRTL